MSGQESMPEAEPTIHWPVIRLLEGNSELVRDLEHKTHEYEDRVFADIDHPYVAQALMADYYEYDMDRRYRKTSAFIKWVIADEVLQNGVCDTEDLNRRLHTEPKYLQYFVTIQRRNMTRFDSLVYNAAHVINEYTTGQMPIRRR
jgi:hypothetical protein